MIFTVFHISDVSHEQKQSTFDKNDDDNENDNDTDDDDDDNDDDGDDSDMCPIG